MKADLENPVPDIAEQVEREGHKWRVTGWYKTETRPPNEFHDKERILVHACKRNEATLIGIYAVCGSIVKLGEVSRIGEYVQWDEKTINEDREAFLSSVAWGWPIVTSEESYPSLYYKIKGEPI